MLDHCFLIRQRNDWETVLLSFPRVDSLFRGRGALSGFERFFSFWGYEADACFVLFFLAPYISFKHKEQWFLLLDWECWRHQAPGGSRSGISEVLRYGRALVVPPSCRSLRTHPILQSLHQRDKREGLCLTCKWMKMNMMPRGKKKQNKKTTTNNLRFYVFGISVT